MRNRLAGVLLVCMCITGTLFALPWFQQTAQNEWKEYSYPDDGFLISSPSQPALTKAATPVAEGAPEPHNYAIELGNNTGVLISSTEIKGAESVPPKDLLASAKNGAIQSVKGKLTSEKEITLAEYPGIQFEGENENFHMRARMYVVKSKLLTLLAIAPTGAPIPPEATRVFDSFKLVKSAESGAKK